MSAPTKPLPTSKLQPFLVRMAGLMGTKPKAGDETLLLSISWIETFASFCSQGSTTPPGPINNSDLFDSAGKVRADVQSFAIGISRMAWDQLVKL